jgi:anti-sigma factor RsiW
MLMPSELSEPTLDELSAYIDDELDGGTKATVAQHVTGCAHCQARVDGLRQTANAVRGLPMESPPRTFTIPAQRRQASRRWAPVGWLGGAAAALLVIVYGVSQLHGLGGAGTTASSSNGGAGTASQYRAAAPAAAAPSATNQNQLGIADSAMRALSSSPNQVTVVDPRNSSRGLTVGTDQAKYAANGRMLVTGLLTGDSSATTGQVRLVLRRGGYGVQLGSPSGAASGSAGFRFQGAYTIAKLPLADPSAGNYTLTVTWTAADGSGATLIAELPVTITG